MTVEEQVTKAIEITEKGCQPYYDVLPDLINGRGYKTGMEIGVLFGGNAYSILEKTNIDMLVGIDPYELYEQEILGMETQENCDYIYKFILRRLDPKRYKHLRMTSDMALVELLQDKGSFDFIFIDGLHTYEQVKRDLNGFSPLIRKGGVIACHDYNHPNYPLVTNAIDEFAEQHKAKINICPFHAIYMDKTW